MGTTLSFSRRTAALFAVATVAAVGLAGCGSDSDDSADSGPVDQSVLGTPNKATGAAITLGFISEGKAQAYDKTNEIKGAQAAAKYINEYLGGINGHPIELKVCEAHGNPADATDCANQMVQAKVPAVIEGALGTVDPTVDVLTKAKIPLVLHFTSSPKTLQTPGVFGLMNGTASIFGAPAHLAKEKKITSASIVTIDVPAAVAGTEQLGKLTFGNAGAKAEVVTIPPGTPDPSAQITAANRSKPGMYSILGTPDFCVPVIKAIRSVAPNAPIAAVDRCIASGAAKSIPNGYEGVEVGTTSNLDPETEGVKLFAAALDKFSSGTPVESDSAYGWAPVLAVARALNGAKVTDLTAESITTGLRNAPAQEYPLTNGIQFQCNGKAFALSPNVCSVGGIQATADKDGNLSDYRVVDDPSLFTMPTS